MSAFGRLYGVGIGPGDPDLLTVKATKVIAASPVVAYFAKAGRRGNARAIVDCWLNPSHVELPLYYPMTNETHFDDPPYRDALARFYKECTVAIASHLEAGRDVALLSEGDPMLYGSFEITTIACRRYKSKCRAVSCPRSAYWRRKSARLSSEMTTYAGSGCRRNAASRTASAIGTTSWPE